VGHHLENYAKYNRREKSDLELLIGGAKKAIAGTTKHMEVVSLHVLTALREKDARLCLNAIMELPTNQLNYIQQIAE